MLSFLLFVTGVVLLIDTTLLVVFDSGWSAFGYGLSMVFFYLARKTAQKEETLHASGWDIGPGLDIENPDQPKKVHVVLEDKALNLGLLAIGGPGSGKTIMALGSLHYYTTQRGGGWCYWEGKGDLDIYQKCVACGAAPDKFFSCELPHSDTVNVFAGPVENVIERLSRTLISDESEYYGNAQRSALRKVVPLLKSLDVPTTLQDLYVVLRIPAASLYVMNKAKEQGVDNHVIESARLFFEIDEKERMNQINGLLNRMDVFVTGQIADRINAYQPTLDLQEAATQGWKVYLHMPYTRLAKDVATMLTESVGVIATRRQLYETARQPWPQVFDDWGAFFYDNFGPITARCRSAGMPISFLFQSRGQTDRVEAGRIFTTEVTDNIGGMVILRINGQDTAEWAANQFGRYETAELSRTENTSYEGNNLTMKEAPRVKSDTLRDLDAGEAYINCLVTGAAGRIDNKRYLTRFPMLDFKDSDSVKWPVIATIKNNDCEGLHLWRDFMDKDRLKELKKQIVEKELEKSSADATSRVREVDHL